jgi:N-acetylneuraminate synthase
MSERVFIIAEAGVNHNGSLEMAMELINVAADCGADAVKFQTFRSEALASRHAVKAEYQQRTTEAAESQIAMLKRLELSPDSFKRLAEHCRARGIEFLSTPFDLPSLDFLADEMGLKLIKLPSGELTNGPFLLAAARKGREIILSTGMATLSDVAAALDLLAEGYGGHEAMKKRVTLLHCTTEYPAPIAEANLRAMDSLATEFNLPVGFSDHTLGIVVSIAAAARGAKIIEKHFTLDKSLPGPDHQASLAPAELREMVAGIRQVEAALGDGVKAPSPSEIKNMPIARKSLVAACSIASGEILTETNLTAKRPGSGVSPMRWREYLGRPANRAYEIDEPIDVI